MFNYKHLGWILIICGNGLLTGCNSYPQIINFPFDVGGKGLNSLTSELNPQITGKYIVFVSDRNGSQDIYLYDLAQRRFLDLLGLNNLQEITSHPSISQDGRYLVYATSDRGKSAIYLYDRQTQQKRNLTEKLATEVRNPTISADGSKIALEIVNNGQWDIAIVDKFGRILINN